jgi:C4-dicarboxylate transporter, DctM subunit
MGLFFAGGMAALLLIGVPVAFALSLLAAIGLYWFNGGVLGLHQIPIIAYKALDDFTISSLPM